jgi:hypothetical protein
MKSSLNRRSWLPDHVVQALEDDFESEEFAEVFCAGCIQGDLKAR